MRRYIGSALLLLAIAPMCAKADWQGTKWGMTVDDLRLLQPNISESIDKKKAKAKTDKERVFVAIWDANGQRLNVLYKFADGEKLSEINVLSDHFDKLQFSLVEHYGTPIKQEPLSETWIDRANNNLIQTTHLSNMGMVKYRPLDREIPSGL